jgi:hypothetical protein
MRLKLRWYQYSLRTLLIAMTIPGLWVGLERIWAQREERAAALFAARGGEVGRTYQWDLLTTRLLPESSLPGVPRQHWLRSLLGDECFTGVVYLWLSGTSVTDDDLATVRILHSLFELDLSNTEVSDVGIAHSRSLNHLQTLSLSDTKVTGSGLSPLRALPQLVFLILDVDQLSPAGVANLRACPQLQFISLRSRTGLTDEQLERVRAAIPGVYVDVN